MMRCSPEFRATCPDGRNCEPWAELTENSECARFSEKVQNALEADARTRYSKIKAMGLDELAQVLLTLHDGDKDGYCKWKPECVETLEAGTPEVITDEHCLECLKGWLLEETE